MIDSIFFKCFTQSSAVVRMLEFSLGRRIFRDGLRVSVAMSRFVHFEHWQCFSFDFEKKTYY